MLNTIFMVLHLALAIATPAHHDAKVSERIITESANGEQSRARQLRHMWREESKRTTTVYPGHAFNDAHGNRVIVEDITITELTR